MKIELYNHNHKVQVEAFFEKCGVKNNSSWESLGSHKRGNHQIFLVLDKSYVVGMCYAHDFSEYYADSIRVWSRSATLPNYRGWNGPKKKGCATAAGCLAHTCKVQWDWAKMNGAKNILFTTNSVGGMSSSQKLGSYLHKVVNYDDSFEWFDNREIFNCKQDVWRILKRDIVN